MKKIIFKIIILLLTIPAFGQVENHTIAVNRHAKLYVAFHSDFNFDASISYANQATIEMPELKSIQERYNFELKKGIPISEAKWDIMENEGIKNSFNTTAIKNLKNIYTVEIPNPDSQLLKEIAEKLELISGIRYCELMPTILPPPPGDILPITPSMTHLQGYIDPNPGVNMQYAWDLGITGSAIKIRDIEYGFNKDHEEFNDRLGARIADGMNISSEVPENWKEHGTAVFGVIYGDHGTYGITGLAHNAEELIFYPEWQESGPDRINAISEALSNSQNGDLIVFEMQDYGQNNQLVLAEINNVVWDLTRAATDLGITVVAAAGNGGQDLDSNYYNQYRNRGDSGAIIVGGGTSNLQHNLYSSTFGTRVDLQAWANSVYTTGYVSILTPDANQRYGYFAGTSSATAIVAGCVAVLQSHYHTNHGGYLSSVQLRNILKLTGIPQGSGGNIGPIPNMQSAVEYINTLNVNNPEQNFFFISPNPAQKNLNIYTKETIEAVHVFDVMGKKQIIIPLSITTFDVSNLSGGMYFLNVISTTGKRFSSKFVKN